MTVTYRNRVSSRCNLEYTYLCIVSGTSDLGDFLFETRVCFRMGQFFSSFLFLEGLKSFVFVLVNYRAIFIIQEIYELF